jgi:hypothetical protein
VSIFLALLHHPVLTRHGDVGSTAVTNVDMHDISRAGRTYGVQRFFVVTPIQLQRELCERVVRHWTEGSGLRNLHRAQAFSRIEIAENLDVAVQRVTEISGESPLLVATGARFGDGDISFSAMRKRLAENKQPVLVLLGTGWGLAPEIVSKMDFQLPAIVGTEGPDGYNHLSVRSAAAILMDRLLGSYT